MILLNFAHPITADQQSALEQLAGSPVERVIEIRTQLDHALAFEAQVSALVDEAGLSPAEWQGARLVVNLPSLSVIAALVLAEAHGRCGYFPAVVRLRPVSGAAPPQFEVAEILNLQAVRDAARGQR